jgi:DnaJ family protein C protein 3
VAFFFFLSPVHIFEKMRHHRYLIACVLPFLFPYSVFGDKSTQQHLAEGSTYLTTGQFSNALHSFDAAIRK